MDMYGDYGSLATAESTTEGVMAALLVAFIGIFILVFIVLMILVILKIIGTWKVLKKAGQPGWAAIIPYYGDYCLCQTAGISPWWVLVIGLSPIASWIFQQIPIAGSFGSIAVSALALYYAVILNISLAKSFGKSEGFAVGMILLNPIFYFALGIGKSTYLGAKPMKDPIMELFTKKDSSSSNVNTAATSTGSDVTTTVSEPTSEVQEQSTNNETSDSLENNSSESQVKFCTSCGSKIEENSSFCTNCGKQV